MRCWGQGHREKATACGALIAMAHVGERFCTAREGTADDRETFPFEEAKDSSQRRSVRGNSKKRGHSPEHGDQIAVLTGMAVVRHRSNSSGRALTW